MKKMVLIPYDQYFHSNSSRDEKADTGQKEEKLDKNLILQPFGKNQRKQAESLLSYVEKNISWNDLGEIIVNEKPVIGSHITDLIKDALFSYKNFEPCGMNVFYANLKNIPSTLIKNPNRIILLGRGIEPTTTTTTTTHLLPPPGIPLGKRAVDLSKNENKASLKKRTNKTSDGTEWIEQWKSL